MKKEILKDYLLNDKVDIDKLLDNFYGYVYIIVKNGVSICLTDEDIEEIAISNIRKEFGMKTNKNKRIVYAISSVCAVFILGVGIFVGTSKLNNNLLQGDTLEIGKTEENINKEESLDIELNINKIKDMEMLKLDLDVKIVESKDLPEKFNFMEKVKIPSEYKFKDSYNVYTRKDMNVEEYNVLHDYVFNYQKDDFSEEIKIAFSEVGEPLRDYFIDDKYITSKIGDAEIIITQYKQMYMASFKYKDIYFDIETSGIKENELAELLVSIIENI